MAFEIPRINYSGKIREVTLGTGSSAVTVGGESCYPFYLFEGAMPRKPRIAFEVWDFEPEEWPIGPLNHIATSLKTLSLGQRNPLKPMAQR